MLLLSNMAKYRGDYDPIDDPSLRDLLEGKDVADQALREIDDVYALSDPFQWGEYGYPVPDPESLLVRVHDIRSMLESLPKPEKEKIEQDIRGLVDRVVQVYPHFVTDLVERFGYAQSIGREARMSAEDIREVIAKAIDASSRIRADKMQDYLITIFREEHRLTLLVKEPRYYVFEREAAKLERELSEAAFPFFWGDRWDPKRAIGDAGEAEAKLKEREKIFEETTARLAQLMEEMHDPLVKGIAQDTLQRFGQYLEFFKKRNEESGTYQPEKEVRPVQSIDNAYRALGFTGSLRPSKEEVTKQYVKLAMENHPDKVGDEGTKRMAAINVAMKVLRETWEKEDA